MSSTRTSAQNVARVVAGIGGVGGIALAIWLALRVAVAHPNLVGQDWWWYNDGLARLEDARPLYDPAQLAGPYDALSPEHWFTFHSIPPFALTLVSPLLIIPHDLRANVWVALNILILASAIATAWPRDRLMGLAIAGLGLYLGWRQLVTANLNGWAALGVALVLCTRRPWLIAFGLALVGTKVIPVVPLIGWLLLRRAWGPLGRALVLVIALTLPIIIIEGPQVMLDSVHSSLDVLQHRNTNFSPTLALGLPPSVGAVAAAALVGAALAWRRDAIGAATAVCASLLAVPNLWSHWLVVPMVALLCVVRTAGGSTATSLDGVGDLGRPGSLPAAGAPPQEAI